MYSGHNSNRRMGGAVTEGTDGKLYICITFYIPISLYSAMQSTWVIIIIIRNNTVNALALYAEVFPNLSVGIYAVCG